MQKIRLSKIKRQCKRLTNSQFQELVSVIAQTVAQMGEWDHKMRNLVLFENPVDVRTELNLLSQGIRQNFSEIFSAFFWFHLLYIPKLAKNLTL